MKRQIITVLTNRTFSTALNKLLATGLYGRTRGEALERLAAERLHQLVKESGPILEDWTSYVEKVRLYGEELATVERR